MRTINEIVIHCSASEWGCSLAVDQWHRAQGWRHIGYHFVILNGRVHSSTAYYSYFDGSIDPGLDINLAGIHVANHNADTVGICLIGDKKFTNEQLKTTKLLVTTLANAWGVKPEKVFGHYEYPGANKTCPNIPMDSLRKFIFSTLSLENLQKDIASRNV